MSTARVAPAASPRLDLAGRAAALRKTGMTLREIGARLGISRSYASVLLLDPDGSKDRERKLKYAATCEGCGARDNGSSGKRDHYLCGACLQEERTGARNRRIVERWNAGWSVSAIAAEERIEPSNVGTIIDYLRREKGLNVARRIRRRREAWPLVQAQWNEGKTYAEIAVALGTNKANVTQMVQAMRRAGLDLPRRQPTRKPRDQARWDYVARRWRDGATAPEIAAELDVQLPTVYSLIERMRRCGVDLPFRWQSKRVADAV